MSAGGSSLDDTKSDVNAAALAAKLVQVHGLHSPDLDTFQARHPRRSADVQKQSKTQGSWKFQHSHSINGSDAHRRFQTRDCMPSRREGRVYGTATSASDVLSDQNANRRGIPGRRCPIRDHLDRQRRATSQFAEFPVDSMTWVPSSDGDQSMIATSDFPADADGEATPQPLPPPPLPWRPSARTSVIPPQQRRGHEFDSPCNRQCYNQGRHGLFVGTPRRGGNSAKETDSSGDVPSGARGRNFCEGSERSHSGESNILQFPEPKGVFGRASRTSSRHLVGKVDLGRRLAGSFSSRRRGAARQPVDDMPAGNIWLEASLPAPFHRQGEERSIISNDEGRVPAASGTGRQPSPLTSPRNRHGHDSTPVVVKAVTLPAEAAVGGATLLSSRQAKAVLCLAQEQGPPMSVEAKAFSEQGSTPPPHEPVARGRNYFRIGEGNEPGTGVQDENPSRNTIDDAADPLAHRSSCPASPPVGSEVISKGLVAGEGVSRGPERNLRAHQCRIRPVDRENPLEIAEDLWPLAKESDVYDALEGGPLSPGGKALVDPTQRDPSPSSSDDAKAVGLSRPNAERKEIAGLGLGEKRTSLADACSERQRNKGGATSAAPESVVLQVRPGKLCGGLGEREPCTGADAIASVPLAGGRSAAVPMPYFVGQRHSMDAFGGPLLHTPVVTSRCLAEPVVLPREVGVDDICQPRLGLLDGDINTTADVEDDCVWWEVDTQ